MQELLEKVTKQDFLRKKTNPREEKNSALEQEVQDTTGTISEDRRMRDESFSERNANKNTKLRSKDENRRPESTIPKK